MLNSLKLLMTSTWKAYCKCLHESSHKQFVLFNKKYEKQWEGGQFSIEKKSSMVHFTSMMSSWGIFMKLKKVLKGELKIQAIS